MIISLKVKKLMKNLDWERFKKDSEKNFKKDVKKNVKKDVEKNVRKVKFYIKNELNSKHFNWSSFKTFITCLTFSTSF